MFNTTLQVNKNNVTFNSVAGTLIKSCEKSKIIHIRANTKIAESLFDTKEPYIASDDGYYRRTKISVLQVMLCANDYLLVEFVELEE